MKRFFLLAGFLCQAFFLTAQTNDWQLFPQDQISFWEITRSNGTKTYDIYYNDSTEVLGNGAKKHYFGAKYYYDGLSNCASNAYNFYYGSNIPFVVDNAIENTDGSWQFGTAQFNPNTAPYTVAVETFAGFADSVRTYTLPQGVLKLSKTAGVIDFPFYGEGLQTYSTDIARLKGFNKAGQHYGFTNSFLDYFGDIQAGDRYYYESSGPAALGQYRFERRMDSVAQVTIQNNSITMDIVQKKTVALSFGSTLPLPPNTVETTTVSNVTKVITPQSVLGLFAFEHPKFKLFNSDGLTMFDYVPTTSALDSCTGTDISINSVNANIHITYPSCIPMSLSTVDYLVDKTFKRNLGQTQRISGVENVYTEALIGVSKAGNGAVNCGSNQLSFLPTQNNNWKLFPQNQISFWEITRSNGTKTYDIYYNDSTEVLGSGAKKHYFGAKYYYDGLGNCASTAYNLYYGSNIPFVVDNAIENTDGSWQFGTAQFNPNTAPYTVAVEAFAGFADSVRTYTLPQGVLKLSKTAGVIDFPFYGEGLQTYSTDIARLKGFNKAGNHYGFTSSYRDYYGNIQPGDRYYYRKVSTLPTPMNGTGLQYQHEQRMDSITQVVVQGDSIILNIVQKKSVAISSGNTLPLPPNTPMTITVSNITKVITPQSALGLFAFEHPKFKLFRKNGLTQLDYTTADTPFDECSGVGVTMSTINSSYMLQNNCSTSFISDNYTTQTYKKGLGNTSVYLGTVLPSTEQLVGVSKFGGDNCGSLNWLIVQPGADFIPTIDIESLTFLNASVSRDFVIHVSETRSGFSYSPVTIKIPKLSGFDITFQPDFNGLANVFGGTYANNNLWEMTQNSMFLTLTLKPGVVFNQFDIKSIALSLTPKNTTPSQTIQNLSITIVNQSGGDYNDDNNGYGVGVSTQ